MGNLLVIDANVTLDLTGLSCPHPLLGARKVLGELKPGEVLLLISDCPGTQDDLFSWIKLTDNELVKSSKNTDGAGEYFIRKGKHSLPTFQVTLDMRGAVCPGPIIEARKILRSMQPDEVLRLISSCNAARDDVNAWVRNSEYTLLKSREIDPGVLEFYLKKDSAKIGK